MSRAARIVVAVLASIWFLPVSCTIATAVGSQMLARADERDAARGDRVHSSIAVVALPSAAPGAPLEHVLLGHAKSYRDRHPDASFLMLDDAGRIDVEGHTQVAYRVVQRSPSGQTIETDYRDGDRTAWGRYLATRSEITPLASRLGPEGYLYEAMVYALAAALAVYAVAARIARRRLSASRPSAP